MKSLFPTDSSTEGARQRQNLLNVLYQGHDVWKRVLATPEYSVLQWAYVKEVATNGSSTALARDLSYKMRAKKTELQDAIAQDAVDRIDSLPADVITAVSDIIDAGIGRSGSQYRYPDFDELLRQVGV